MTLFTKSLPSQRLAGADRTYDGLISTDAPASHNGTKRPLFAFFSPAHHHIPEQIAPSSDPHEVADNLLPETVGAKDSTPAVKAPNLNIPAQENPRGSSRGQRVKEKQTLRVHPEEDHPTQSQDAISYQTRDERLMRPHLAAERSGAASCFPLRSRHRCLDRRTLSPARPPHPTLRFRRPKHLRLGRLLMLGRRRRPSPLPFASSGLCISRLRHGRRCGMRRTSPHSRRNTSPVGDGVTIRLSVRRGKIFIEGLIALYRGGPVRSKEAVRRRLCSSCAIRMPREPAAHGEPNRKGAVWIRTRCKTKQIRAPN